MTTWGISKPRGVPTTPRHVVFTPPNEMTYAIGSVEWAEKYKAEQDANLTAEQRKEAYEARLAAEREVVQAAIEAVRTTGICQGWTVIAHADRTATTSAGHPIDSEGHLLVRDADLEAVAQHGFRPVRWPVQ